MGFLGPAGHAHPRLDFRLHQHGRKIYQKASGIAGKCAAILGNMERDPFQSQPRNHHLVVTLLISKQEITLFDVGSHIEGGRLGWVVRAQG